MAGAAAVTAAVTIATTIVGAPSSYVTGASQGPPPILSIAHGQEDPVPPARAEALDEGRPPRSVPRAARSGVGDRAPRRGDRDRGRRLAAAALTAHDTGGRRSLHGRACSSCPDSRISVDSS